MEIGDPYSGRQSRRIVGDSPLKGCAVDASSVRRGPVILWAIRPLDSMRREAHIHNARPYQMCRAKRLS